MYVVSTMSRSLARPHPVVFPLRSTPIKSDGGLTAARTARFDERCLEWVSHGKNSTMRRRKSRIVPTGGVNRFDQADLEVKE